IRDPATAICRLPVVAPAADLVREILPTCPVGVLPQAPGPEPGVAPELDDLQVEICKTSWISPRADSPAAGDHRIDRPSAAAPDWPAARSPAAQLLSS